MAGGVEVWVGTAGCATSPTGDQKRTYLAGYSGESREARPWDQAYHTRDRALLAGWRVESVQGIYSQKNLNQ